MNIFEIIKQFDKLINLPDAIIYLTGMILLAFWLLKTSLGRNALADSSPRRNNMPRYLPFIALLTWFGGVPIAFSITTILLPDLSESQKALLENLVFCIGAVIIIGIIIYVARDSFARRLKGFGLDIKTIPKDLFFAFVNLLSVWPLIFAAMIITIFFGKIILGRDFYLEQHEAIKTITAYPQLLLRVFIIVTTVIVGPVLEEMLFRGLLQTMMRSFFESRNRIWLAILISSGLFAMVHANAGHWPALFMLALCLGYSYEKIGSLLRPIFIHSLFNSVAIIMVLSQ